MNLENLTHADFPFNHWVFRNCLEEGALDEISYSGYATIEQDIDPTEGLNPLEYAKKSLAYLNNFK